MSNPIILPNIISLDEYDPISAGPAIINANFQDLSAYATSVSAGLIQLADFGDTLLPIVSQQKAVSPYVLNERLSGTFHLVPAITNAYNLGSLAFPYKNLFLGNKLILSGSVLSVSGGQLLLDGGPIVPEDDDKVGIHNLEDSLVHTNVSGSPTSGMTFLYQPTSGWGFGFPGRINPNGNPNDGDTLLYDSITDTYLPGVAPSAATPPPETIDEIGDVVASNPNVGDGLIYNGSVWISDKVDRIIPQLEHRNFIFNRELLSGTVLSDDSFVIDINTLDFYDPVLIPENVAFITAVFELSAGIGGTATVKHNQVINTGESIDPFAVPLVSVFDSYKEELVNIPVQRDNENLDLSFEFTGASGSITYKIIGYTQSTGTEVSPGIDLRTIIGETSGTSGYIDFNTSNNGVPVIDTSELKALAGEQFWGDGITPGSGIMPLQLPINTIRTKFLYQGYDVSGQIDYMIDIDFQQLQNVYHGVYHDYKNGDFGGCSGNIVDLVTSGAPTFIPSVGSDPSWTLAVQNITELITLPRIPVNDDSFRHEYSIQSFISDRVNDDTVLNTSEILALNISHDIVITDQDVSLPELTSRYTNKTYTLRNKGVSNITVAVSGSSTIDGDTLVPSGETRKYAADVVSDTWFQI